VQEQIHESQMDTEQRLDALIDIIKKRRNGKPEE
jgi:hypothetical protein